MDVAVLTGITHLLLIYCHFASNVVALFIDLVNFLVDLFAKILWTETFCLTDSLKDFRLREYKLTNNKIEIKDVEAKES